MSAPAAGAARSAVAIGVFDGLHRGHRAILERARARAAERGGRAVVVTFDPHPDVVLARGDFRIAAPLTPIGEKRARLAAMGLDALDLVPFTRELAAMEPEDFVAAHLVRPHAPHTVVVGEGFALGRGRSGNVDRLAAIGRSHGFTVEAVPLVPWDGEPVSSTRIRARLAEGRVAEAGRLLGREYTLTGCVVTGEGIGRTLGYPTANLRLHEEKLLPRDGIYAVRVGIGDEPPRRAGAMSLGVRPTFDGKVRTLEVFLLDFDAPLVGRDLTLALVDWLRAEERFESPAALVEAMHRDVAETRRRLEALPPIGD